MSPTRRSFLKVGAAAAIAGGRFLPARADDRSRVALVIGNNGYPEAPLANAVNDAKAVATILERAGFAVELKTDLSRDGMREALQAFRSAAASSGTRQALFYYAGHGVESKWRNFLVPVDARVIAEADIAAQCIELNVLLTELSGLANKAAVVILDACRDNPFGSAYRPEQIGLAQFDAPLGVLLAFATSPGSVAADGTGANGLYTEHLVRELAVEGVRIEDALKRTRLAVRLASNGAQTPWASTSLAEEVFLFPNRRDKPSKAELDADYQRELVAWNRTKVSRRPEDWAAYLHAYPNGKFNQIAERRLEYLLLPENEQRERAAPIDSQHPQLQIGPGLPVPTLMRMSANAASAGTYSIGRRYSVGDEVVYAESDPIFGTKQPDLPFRVTRVDEDADLVEFNSGKYTWDSMGNTVSSEKGSYEPRLQHVPSDLQIGRTWTTRFRSNGPGFSYEIYFDSGVVAREKVRVPAGEFEAFRVEAVGFNLTTGARLTNRSWVVPGFNYMLRVEFIVQPRWGTRSGELREMLSCRQMRWQMA